MNRVPFSFSDIASECELVTGCHRLDGKAFGAKIFIPETLHQRYPYNSSAYGFLQQLRQAIFEYGTIEFPDLPVNRVNHTVAIRSPHEHSYSSNPFLTDHCQSPHQDTPPYPTAFWLPAQRQYFATWLLSLNALEDYLACHHQQPGLSVDELHRQLVPQSLNQGSGLLVNQSPGLILIDNSPHHALYHARTCNFESVANNPGYCSDAPLYAFNEPGLLHYIDSIDSQRGQADRDEVEVEQVRAFMSAESADATR